MIYMDESYIRLEWDATDNLVIAVWNGFFTSEQFRAALYKGLDVIAAHHATNWLADVTYAKVTTLADQDHLSYTWTPLAIERGLQRLAYVVPVDLIAQMALNRIVRQTSGVELRYFSDVAEARQWLTTATPVTNPSPVAS